MASSLGIDIEHRRWLVVGTVLNRVVMPYLRDKIQQEMTPFYHNLVVNHGLDKQTYSAHQKTIPPSTLKLNYESINGNGALHRDTHRFDYCVKSEVSLAKLFMKPFMAHFTAFDTSFDASAALAVLCCASPFSSAALSAELVRSEVRNDWAHCDYASWTELKYDTCFDCMKTLVKDLGLSSADEKDLLGKLQLWKEHGLEFCVGKPLDDTFLNVIRDEVQVLSGSLPEWLEKTNDNINQVCDMLKSVLDKNPVIIVSKEQPTGQELKEGSSNSLQVTSYSWDALLSRDFSVSTAHYRSILIFDAPDQNKWFTGRQKELGSLERCFALNDDCHIFRMAAICGLGGCGKTTSAAQFAWKHKAEYTGGVFWFSMEDEEKFEGCVNDLAIRLRMMKKSFDLTLAQILTFISQQKECWLMVLDNVDQLQLSERMRKVLKGIWKRRSNGHMLITTRRERREICQCVDLDPNCCVEISSFSIDEAKEFLLSRFSGENAASQENMLNELVVELGCLPLALEQAAAHIKSLQCPVNEYLKEYRSERDSLLSEHQANPSREYDSLNRLSVHTTWLLNFDYVSSSKYGEMATRFVHAAAFLDPDEIHEGLISAELLSPDFVAQKERELPLTNKHIVEVLTKFSLFQRKSGGCMRIHRVVQQVIRGTMTSQEIEKALCTTFQLLKNAAQSAGRSTTDMSVFSIIRHWLALKRHMEREVQATPDIVRDKKLAKLIKSGADEIVFAVTHTLEGSTQTLENHRRLSALLDGNYDRWLGGRRLMVDLDNPCRKSDTFHSSRSPPRQRSAPLYFDLSSRLSSGLSPGSTLGSSQGSPSQWFPVSSLGSFSGSSLEGPVQFFPESPSGSFPADWQKY